ncbi:LysR substrate-binding domain-containing protein [Gracilimonas mengyeensis]|uniref:Transcriptional regulator, LysR family n=1 Tax=Gracilimonas mengyeensis TaxID=1302730 RepID=A0A521DU76_9BACT|nr:LysR substrate-binding domain-containing protein [Gracilimonas mengyeensis]SMO74370.1 transcriptional regulator, LysR family [Gracilimonas mengyeensis]
MEVRQLKYLLSIGREGTFTAAAEKLFISQSALSQQVKSMEEELGVPLFDRSRNRLHFTEAGALLHQRAKHIVREVEEAKKAIHELEQLYRGTLRIGVVQTINAYLIPKIVAHFSSRYPEVQLRVHELSAPEIERQLSEHELDLGLSFKPTDYPKLTFDPLFEEELMLIVNPQHPFARREEVEAKALESEQLMLLSEGYCTRRIWDEAAKMADISPKVLIEMNTISSLLSALEDHPKAGTILPALTMKMKAAHGLSAIRIVHPSPTRTAGILWRAQGYRSKASRKLAEIATNMVQELKQ